MRHIAVVTTVVVAVTINCAAESPYTDSSFFNTLYNDRKAATVGDVLHILVTESARATQSASRSLNKQSDVSLGPGLGWVDFMPLNAYSGGSSYSADASANRSGSIQARLSVRVKETLPNGNLRVEGRRHVRVNKDVQEIVFSGTVRPRDIQANNTVYSYDVADLEIDYQGSDPARPGNKVGIITRLLNWLF